MARLQSGTIFALLAALALAGARLGGQTAARRATSPSALLTFSGFYQGQPVVVRGNLATRDQPVLLSESTDRSIPLVFKGPSPADGPVELRATFWDVGRLTREDPRIRSLGLDRLLPQGMDGEWPRPGEVVALAVTDAIAAKPPQTPSLREIALTPSSYVGQRVTIKGQFRGRNLYGDVPQGPGLSQWDFVLKSADAAIWVTGQRPRGRGFNLNTSARVDTGTWLEATGIVREGKGLAWIEAQQLALGTPELETRTAEAPVIPQMGPPPEVIFSDPGQDEVGVSLKTAVRLQFSRDMNPESFKDRVRWSFTGDSDNANTEAGGEPGRQPAFKYDGAKRALEIPLDVNDAAAFRTVVVELADGIAASDGAKLAPWKLTFSFGGQ